MEPERERTGRAPKRGKKRRRVANQLVGAAEAMRARWDLEERQQPEAKVSNGDPEGAARGGLELPDPNTIPLTLAV